MSLAILVPVLNRPHRAAPLVEAFTAATFEQHRIVFICTEDDDAEQDACRATGTDVLVLPGPWQRGDYGRKMNYGYRNTTEEVLFLAADDIVPAAGWYSTAAALFSEQIQVVGTNDLGNQRVMNGVHSTHTLITRKYADEQGTVDGPGAIFCEGYNHWYCDDEFIQTAQARGAFAPCLESIVEHFHYYWKHTEKDATYKLGERYRNNDRRLYERRKHLWAA
jgi:glycosyltransferase involved in cell wall biosynthesis